MVSRLDRETSWQIERPDSTQEPLDAEILAIKSNYSILEVKDIKKIQMERIREVSEELGISENVARAMLIRNGWARQAAIDALLQDPDYIMKEFKLDLNITKNPRPSSEVFCCPVCFCDCEPDEVVTMDDCFHELCIDCFTGFCMSKLGGGPDVVYTECPDMKCKLIVPENIFKQVLGPSEFKKYDDYVMKSFVDLSKTAKWCPAADCGKIIENKFADAIEVECKCASGYCFKCMKEPHIPIDCDMMESW